MSYEYIAYIDEAGDDGIKRIKAIDGIGASEWFVLAAVVVRKNKNYELLRAIEKTKIEFGIQKENNIHFRKLSFNQKKIIGEKLAKLPVRFFAVVSNKKNIRKHKNIRAEKVNAKSWVYNFMTRLLLERVTEFCGQKKGEILFVENCVRIEFSRRGGINYNDTINYLKRLKNQKEYAGGPFLKAGSIDWAVVDFAEIRNIRHSQSPGLQAADIVASSFYNSLDSTMKDGGNKCFALSLLPRMGRKRDSKSGQIAEVGLKIMPHFSSIKITKNQQELFEKFGYFRKS